jgi:hypothetical protein
LLVCISTEIRKLPIFFYYITPFWFFSLILFDHQKYLFFLIAAQGQLFVENQKIISVITHFWTIYAVFCLLNRSNRAFVAESEADFERPKTDRIRSGSVIGVTPQSAKQLLQGDGFRAGKTGVARASINGASHSGWVPRVLDARPQSKE